MTQNSGRNNRTIKNFLIRPKDQFNFVLKVIIINLGIILFMFGCFTVVFNDQVLDLLLSKISAEETLLVKNSLNKLYVLSAFQFVFMAFIMSLVILIGSHRLFGAVYALELAIDRLINNDLDKKIGLRKNDYLQSLALKLDKLRIKLNNSNEG